MEWQDAIGEVAKFAPAVATALGGPAAGGITAGASRMVTGLLGIENTADSLSEAVQDPEKRAELIRINNEHKRELEKMRMEAETAEAKEVTNRLEQTNKTIRAEAASNDAYVRRWRPTFGYLTGLAWTVQGVAIAATIIISPEESAKVSQTITALTPMWGIALAVLGINVSKRSQDKQVAAGQQPSGGFMGAIATRVKGDK